jgi:hypothetical protein
MQNKYITFILLAFLMMGATIAAAGQPQVSVPAVMSDDALASYISGRLKQALKDGDHSVDQYCDASGCAVVVQ